MNRAKGFRGKRRQIAVLSYAPSAMNEAGALSVDRIVSIMRGVIDVFVGQVKCNDLPAVGVNAN